MYSMKPSFLNLFMKKFTRDRVVPTISASTSWEILGSTREQEQRAGQPLFTRVEQLIDEVLFEASIPGEHMRDEAV